jgi:DegV family protein with EDD domain
MNIKIVCDSSSNVFQLEEMNYSTVPMKIIAGNREFVDAPGLNLREMVEFLKEYKGKSGSSCPNVQEWLDAFGDADMVFGVTITKNLSGSYNAAQQAAATYMEENPGKKAYIFDSLSAGPELMLIVGKIQELANAGCDFDSIVSQVLDYHNHCHTIFCLQSITNLARNGRVNPAVAKIAGMLGIRMVGIAVGGTIVPIHKPRGEKKALAAMVESMKERGLRDGSLVRVAHCFGENTANAFIAALKAQYPNCRIILEHTSALCSFYAEVGGLIVAYEGGFNQENDNSKF